MSTKFSISWKYGNLIKIKNFKESDHYHDDQQDLEEEKDEKLKSSLPLQIDPKKKLLNLNLNGFLICKVHVLKYFICIFIPSRIAYY